MSRVEAVPDSSWFCHASFTTLQSFRLSKLSPLQVSAKLSILQRWQESKLKVTMRFLAKGTCRKLTEPLTQTAQGSRPHLCFLTCMARDRLSSHKQGAGPDCGHRARAPRVTGVSAQQQMSGQQREGTG